MAKAKPAPAAVDHDQLCECIQELRDQVQVLTDAIDELRSNVQWIANNCEPAGESPNGSCTGKRMPADPCVKDGAARPAAERGEAADTSFAEHGPVVVQELEYVIHPDDRPPPAPGRKQPRLF